MKNDKKDLIDPVTGSLLSIVGISALEIFKAIVGFFTWIALKNWWHKWHQKKGEEDGQSDS